MKLNIRGENIELTSALREYTEKKIGRLGRYFNTPLDEEVAITLTVIRDAHIVEVTIPLKGALLRAEVKDGDMYAAIDMAVDKLERQIRKHKTKINRKYRYEGSMRSLLKEDALEGAGSVAEEDDFELVRTKKFAMKPMDIEEAILQMNLIGHNFFVFSNMDTDEINVVYKRNDGNYGVIEPALA